ncbi:MAG: hypothetical protein HQL63_06655 [Magnetococcales bacterium]|nr:hypothetical protein [Magnetococcales bacterium]
MVDSGSETWKTISQWAKEELQRCHEDIVISSPMEETERLRGRIQILTALLSLARPRGPITAFIPDYRV